MYPLLLHTQPISTYICLSTICARIIPCPLCVPPQHSSSEVHPGSHHVLDSSQLCLHSSQLCLHVTM